MLNVSQLNTIHGDDIPADLQEALKCLENRLMKQRNKVKNVTVLANCSIDHDRTKHLQSTQDSKIPFVLQGLVVTVDPEYVLAVEDAMWFHPEMGKGRSVYKIENDLSVTDLNKIKEVGMNGKYDKQNMGMISPFQCDIGQYNTLSIDEMGIATSDKTLVVNVSMEALTYPLWTRYLVSNETVGKVYENWASMDMGNGKSITDTSVLTRDNVASTVLGKASNPIYRDQVNALYSDGTDIYIANHAIKTPKDENEKVLIHCSALAGYELFNTNSEELFTPSNVGISTETFGWDEMSLVQRKRVFNDCVWEGKEGFNTYVMKPPGLTSIKKKSFEHLYSLSNSTKMNMKCAKFSSQPIRDYLDMQTLAKLTPRESHISGTAAAKTNKRVGDHLEVKMSLSNPPFAQLIEKFELLSVKHPEFKLFNSELISDGYIKIPRKVLNNL
jgi:hypothetical protein